MDVSPDKCWGYLGGNVELIQQDLIANPWPRRREDPGFIQGVVRSIRLQQDCNYKASWLMHIGKYLQNVNAWMCRLIHTHACLHLDKHTVLCECRPECNLRDIFVRTLLSQRFTVVHCAGLMADACFKSHQDADVFTLWNVNDENQYSLAAK